MEINCGGKVKKKIVLPEVRKRRKTVGILRAMSDRKLWKWVFLDGHWIVMMTTEKLYKNSRDESNV